MKGYRDSLPIVVAFFLAAVTASAATREVDDRTIADESNAADWLPYGRTHSEQRFSPLRQVKDQNVSQRKVD